MIIGIGCDIVEHDTVEKLEWESDEQLLKRFFSQKEFDLYCIKKSVKFIAGRFAAKEAVVKSLGTGMCDGISLAEIQILQTKAGQAEIELIGEVKKVSDELGINLWHVSITHSANKSIAFVIAES